MALPIWNIVTSVVTRQNAGRPLKKGDHFWRIGKKFLAVFEQKILTPTFIICLKGNGTAFFASAQGSKNWRYTTGLRCIHWLLENRYRKLGATCFWTCVWVFNSAGIVRFCFIHCNQVAKCCCKRSSNSTNVGYEPSLPIMVTTNGTTSYSSSRYRFSFCEIAMASFPLSESYL